MPKADKGPKPGGKPVREDHTAVPVFDERNGLIDPDYI